MNSTEPIVVLSEYDCSVDPMLELKSISLVPALESNGSDDVIYKLTGERVKLTEGTCLAIHVSFLPSNYGLSLSILENEQLRAQIHARIVEPITLSFSSSLKRYIQCDFFPVTPEYANIKNND